MALDGKFKYIEKKMKTTDLQLFQYITKEELMELALIEKNTVLIKPVDVDKFQEINGLYVELPTTPKMLGEVIESTVDSLKKGDNVLYCNNYIMFKYFIDINDKESMYFLINNDDIVMVKK